jgi:APA family basic amino acid/polyamine antiporter
MPSSKHIGFYTATAIVVANMIGTGVFTSLGFQCAEIKSGFALLLLWVVGGIAALTGALCYGEIGATLPRSGGEYHYLSKIYHPAGGFLSGWVSATVGFAAPVAASAIALGKYTVQVFPSVSATALAAIVVIVISFVHTLNISIGKGFQNSFTTLKVIMIVAIIFFGVFGERTGNAGFMPSSDTWSDLLSSSFAISLYFVAYSYSGWNASAYVAGEIDHPQKNLPRSLFFGTLLVTVLYVLLNFVFLYTAPLAELSGQLEVGFISANHIFGLTGGKIMGMIIAVLLVSSVSSMIIAGPRVTQMMGEDYRFFKIFSTKNEHGIPAFAIVAQCIISLFFVFTATFEQVITYIGFTLNLFLFLTVAGIFVLRIRQPNLERPYKTWGYPVTPVIFLIIGTWILIYGLIYKPTESLAGLGTVATGLIIYFAEKFSGHGKQA